MGSPIIRLLIISYLLLGFTVAPRTSDAIRVVYKTDTQIRVEWEPVTDANVQHYEVGEDFVTGVRVGLPVLALDGAYQRFLALW